MILPLNPRNYSSNLFQTTTAGEAVNGAGERLPRIICVGLLCLSRTFLVSERYGLAFTLSISDKPPSEACVAVHKQLRLKLMTIVASARKCRASG